MSDNKFDKWLVNNKTLVFFAIILLFVFNFFVFIPYRPGFLKVKPAPSQIAELKTLMVKGFEDINQNINKRFDKQDSINVTTIETMKRVPKIFPAPGAKITSNYGMRDSVMHWGIDISNKKGTQIQSPVSGTVVSAKFDDGYGNCTIIDSGIFKVKIAHQDKMFVIPGQWVTQGQIIGTVGNTGFVTGKTGVHEHIEIERNDKKEDPKTYL